MQRARRGRSSLVEPLRTLMVSGIYARLVGYECLSVPDTMTTLCMSYTVLQRSAIELDTRC